MESIAVVNSVLRVFAYAFARGFFHFLQEISTQFYAFIAGPTVIAADLSRAMVAWDLHRIHCSTRTVEGTNMKAKRMGIGAAALMCGLLFGLPANATLILDAGLVGGSGDVDNVIFNACGLGSSSGTTVQGCLNGSHTTLVNFTGNESLTIGGGGQAVIDASDGSFDYVQISLADTGTGFSKLQFNLDALANGSATFQAVDQFGTLFNFTKALSGNGNNFFTLHSLDDQVAISLTLMSTVGLQNIGALEQVRVGLATTTTTVPEPASLALLGLSLFGLGALVRRRTKAI